MKRKLFGVLLVLCGLFGCMLSLAENVKAEEVLSLTDLIEQLPEVSDPLGTKYYFYRQLSDAEKAIYWEMAEATWDNPSVSFHAGDAYSFDQLYYMSQRALAALMADNPEYHMYWERGFGASQSQNEYYVTMHKFPTVTNYHIQKAQARASQLVEMIGSEGDRYSKVREMLELLYSQMEYNEYEIVRTEICEQFDDSVLGCMLQNLAVCGGFADTVKLLCDELGIPCIIVHTEGSFSHAWNYIQMEDGKWYAIDASRDEANSSIMGLASPEYSGENYNSSAPCIVTLYDVIRDFQFPEISDEAYVYSGEYAPTYHDVDNAFVEPTSAFVYEINSDETSCTIISYEGIQQGDLIIPEYIDGYKVTSIGDGAFLRCAGFSGDLMIPDSVVTIGDGAFYQCEGLSGTLSLPSELKEVGEYAFLGCKKLSGNLELPEQLKKLGYGAFIRCESFTGDVHLPNLVELGANCFDYCYGLDGTLYLPDELLWESSIIGDTYFSSIHVNETNTQYTTVDGILYSKDMKTLICCPTGKIGGLIIPDGVEVIGHSAFDTCKAMNGRLVLPESLEVIEGYALFQAGFTGELVIPDSVKVIGSHAFYMTNFTGNLIIPDSVTSVGEGAFLAAAFDGTLSLSNSLQVIESGAFACPNLVGDLIIPDSVKRIESGAFSGCFFGGELILPDSLEFIGSMALAGSSSNYDTTHFSNVLDLSDTDVVVEQDAFMWTVFPDFICNCGIEYVEDERVEPNCSEDGYARTYCGVCAGTRWENLNATGHKYENNVCVLCGYIDVVPGDVNSDGKVDIFDANLIAAYYNEVVDLSEVQLADADVNIDGMVDIFDANLVAAYYNEIIDAFPIG